MKLDAFYNKWRIYATEVYRFMFKNKKARTLAEIKDEYEVPFATCDAPTKDHRDCFVTEDGVLMLKDYEYRARLIHYLFEYLSRFHGVKSFLEVGCGSGKNIRYFSHHFTDCSFFGVDLSEECITEAKAKNSNVSFYCGSAGKLPFADNSIDVIYSVHALEQMNTILPDVIAEMFRVCKMGVVLFEPLYEHQNFFGRLHNNRLKYPRDIVGVVCDKGFSNPNVSRLEFGNPANRSGVIVARKTYGGVKGK